MEQLDGLRAIAVLMVFYHHLMPWKYQFNIPWGDFGVDLFFVLSGFLITGILLKCKHYVEGGGQSVMLTIRRFYARRFLRIFPLYYSTLLACTLFVPVLVQGVAPWLWLYTLNLNRSLVNNTWSGPISHWWSLSVEEQFYLVWPWIILLVPRRLLFRTILFAIFIAPLTKVILAIGTGSYATIRYFTLSCFDTLALGGLLAYFVDKKGLSEISSSKGVRWMLWIGTPIMFAGLWLNLMGDTSLKLKLLFSSGGTLVLGWVIIKAAYGFSGRAGRFLSSSPIVYLGKISYGLYILHKPIPFLLKNLGVPINLLPPIIAFLVYTALAIVVASLSWHLFESPINSLKQKFPYKAKNSTDVPLQLAASG
jgi:peptidoglycan/LPS O-acetylase OafA/YrhL